MELHEILSNAEDQNRGRPFDLLHPVTGKPVKVRLVVAGPDSRVQAEAAALLVDELAEMADVEGRVSGANRAMARRRFLARCVLGWQVEEGGEVLPFSFDRMLRLLAVSWVMAQVDAFAGARDVYFRPATVAADD